MFSDKYWMNIAIKKAQLGGETYKNPRVGAVIVKNNHLLSIGYHHYFGGDHAEVNAYRNVANKDDLKGATLFVTLEPCSHFGKTPPCSHQIVQWGIKKVIVGQMDPHSLVAGKGINYLLNHGVEVITGVNEATCKNINVSYNYFYTHQRPFITLKMSQTLDGKIALNTTTRDYLTNDKANEDVQNLRAKYQAIVVGAHTAVQDNPRLTVRNQHLSHPAVRVIIAGNTDISAAKHLLEDNAAPTYIFTQSLTVKNMQVASHCRVFYKDSWNLAEIMKVLYQQNIQSVLVEGGSKLHDAFRDANLFDQVIQYIVPQIAGGDSLPAFNSLRHVEKMTHMNVKSVDTVGNAIRIITQRK
ncbi:bifunctional diaminohydroxyphosphoribosylaminopyrimidine deaminase/5-amino-6-(5-phosphoribosylamino)uracil reductase RibD [Apilactobacillus bombintestini]|uniref:Riboflavin biosynthesis protein RibD n=1 Tax=Apilactobacillus bombintestini TaxID=2419772 RepID=A0A387AYJ1_9LACO|nr:bifunctional diaminohydroxyphosphoribosylaminopyrimidine deaminase/5-amino-6-(5-phosphoribosylamino)uracil reductase RibD [Apilactobacillus bombintestini]AYF92130.1 bifunctional diaminohydroxyphosphoribosylaminopyrimidine deaminase/5-amino-6-(5-phosphoribosylamino)uracil reductase RibD [Apilactobacillus bombintestini]